MTDCADSKHYWAAHLLGERLTIAARDRIDEDFIRLSRVRAGDLTP